jgi:exonuclease I
VSNPRDTDYLKAAVMVAITQITPQMLNDGQEEMAF